MLWLATIFQPRSSSAELRFGMSPTPSLFFAEASRLLVFQKLLDRFRSVFPKAQVKDRSSYGMLEPSLGHVQLQSSVAHEQHG